jgi:dTDP-4-dehydrorhamnose reductase
MKKRWLITGAGGQLGREFVRLLDGVDEFTAYKSTELDITNSDLLEKTISSIKPTHILNCAAWTNVEKAENNYSEVFQVNAYGVGNLASISRRRDIHLTHFSTDYVFDGQKKTPYETDDLKNPLSVYGLSKSSGEDVIKDINPEGSLIIRTSWLYSVYGSNFVRTMLRIEQERERISVIDDQVGQPTSAADLAEFVVKILSQRDLVGTFHASNSGSASWYDFARMIFDLNGQDPLRILPIRSSEYPQTAKRPPYSVLSHEKWSSVGIPPMQSWQDALHAAFRSTTEGGVRWRLEN